MTRMNQRAGFLSGWLARRAQPVGVSSTHDEHAGSTPSQSLDHPTYLRRGIAISGMALPSSGNGRTSIRAASH